MIIGRHGEFILSMSLMEENTGTLITPDSKRRKQSDQRPMDIELPKNKDTAEDIEMIDAIYGTKTTKEKEEREVRCATQAATKVSASSSNLPK